MFGAKLSWCQIVRCQIVLVPNCPGAKLSTFIILVPNCPFLLSWCQIVLFIILVPNCPVPNCPVLNCPVPNCPTIKSMMTSSENFLTDKNQQRRAKICNICGKEGKQTSIVNHIEAKHLNGVSLPCNDCGLSFTTRNTLAQHKSRAHKNV